MQSEIYKQILGHPDYEISTLGNVKSCKYGKIKMLKLNKHPQGYVRVRLDQKCVSVHRLVIKTFLENLNDDLEVNHKNGIKDDNRLENLEWVTPKENTAHAFSLGLRKVLKNHTLDTRKKMSKSHTGLLRSEDTKRKIALAFSGEKGNNARLTWAKVNEIRANTLKLSQKKLAEKYGVIQQNIGHIINFRRWKVLN